VIGYQATRWATLALAASLLAAASRVSAQPAPDPLGAIVAEALERNLTLAQSQRAEQRASAELLAARTRWLPAVRLETRASQLHDVPDLGDLVNPAYAALGSLTGQPFPTDLSFTLPQRYESHVRVTQPLLNEPLRAGASLAAAQRDAGRLSLRATARALAAQSQAAWLQHASARRLVDIDTATLDLVRENERVAERLLAAGKATPEAVQRARADRAEVQQALAEAREQATAAARELNRVLGRAADAPVETLPDSVFETPLPIGADDAVRSALARREELAAGDAGVRAARAGVAGATGAFLPSVAGAVDVGWQGRESDPARQDRSWTLSLVASWDLFHGGSDLASRSAARHELERLRLARRDAAERIAVEAHNAWDAADVAHDALATSRERAEAARRTWTMVRRRYEEGGASPLELSDARTQLTNAESNQVITLYRYALRRVDLERAAALRDLPEMKGASR
jgi:outer membrane protein TolC